MIMFAERVGLAAVVVVVVARSTEFNPARQRSLFAFADSEH